MKLVLCPPPLVGTPFSPLPRTHLLRGGYFSGHICHTATHPHAGQCLTEPCSPSMSPLNILALPAPLQPITTDQQGAVHTGPWPGQRGRNTQASVWNAQDTASRPGHSPGLAAPSPRLPSHSSTGPLPQRTPKKYFHSSLHLRGGLPESRPKAVQMQTWCERWSTSVSPSCPFQIQLSSEVSTTATHGDALTLCPLFYLPGEPPRCDCWSHGGWDACVWV